ncbi:hypothetical protein D3C79_801850 [compost metagenome]
MVFVVAPARLRRNPAPGICSLVPGTRKRPRLRRAGDVLATAATTTRPPSPTARHGTPQPPGQMAGAGVPGRVGRRNLPVLAADATPGQRAAHRRGRAAQHTPGGWHDPEPGQRQRNEHRPARPHPPTAFGAGPGVPGSRARRPGHGSGRGQRTHPGVRHPPAGSPPCRS